MDGKGNMKREERNKRQLEYVMVNRTSKPNGKSEGSNNIEHR